MAESGSTIVLYPSPEIGHVVPWWSSASSSSDAHPPNSTPLPYS
ncbi:unnamed protein product [Rhodiola kirilowii]